jgi:hypothetical protein
VNPGFGCRDARVVFVTIEPSAVHGKLIEWDAYDWETYNDRYYDRLLKHWDSGEAVQNIIRPLNKVITSDVRVADPIKCPPKEGQDGESRPSEFEHCRSHLRQEIEAIDPDVVVALRNKSATRILEFLGAVFRLADSRRRFAAMFRRWVL